MLRIHFPNRTHCSETWWRSFLSFSLSLIPPSLSLSLSIYLSLYRVALSRKLRGTRPGANLRISMKTAGRYWFLGIFERNFHCRVSSGLNVSRTRRGRTFSLGSLLLDTVRGLAHDNCRTMMDLEPL